MSQDSTEVQKLKRAYRASFTDKSAELSEFINSLDQNNTSAQELSRKIYQCLHKLAGSLAMYDYQKHAEMAQEGMKIITAKTESAPYPELQQSLCGLRDLLSKMVP